MPGWSTARTRTGMLQYRLPTSWGDRRAIQEMLANLSTSLEQLIATIIGT